MKHLKYFLTITCTSFTLVILLNTLFILFNISNLDFNPENILEIFVICLLIAGMCVGIDFIPYIKNHMFLNCYVVMLLIAIMAEYIKTQKFYWSHVFVEIFFLSLVYLAVWFCLYLDDERNVKLINEEIKKRNQK